MPRILSPLLLVLMRFLARQRGTVLKRTPIVLCRFEEGCSGIAHNANPRRRGPTPVYLYSVVAID